MFSESKWVIGLHGLLVQFWQSPRMTVLELDFECPAAGQGFQNTPCPAVLYFWIEVDCI